MISPVRSHSPQRPIRVILELLMDRVTAGAREFMLSKKDHRQIPRGVADPRSAVAPIPAKRTHCRLTGDGVRHNGHAITPASAAENYFAAGTLCRGQVIGCHRLDGGWREQALSTMAAVGKQHARER